MSDTAIKVIIEPGQASVGELTPENIDKFANNADGSQNYMRLYDMLEELMKDFANRGRRCWICITHKEVHYYTMAWTVWSSLAETDQELWTNYFNDPMWWREQISTRGSVKL